MRPKNCDSLKTVEINSEIKLNKQEKINDQHLKWICNDLAKGAQPLASAWAQLLRLEYAIQVKENPDLNFNNLEIDFTPADALVPLDDDHDINLSEIVCHMKLSLKMMGFLHVQAIQKRRIDLSGKLSGAAKQLGKQQPQQPNLLPKQQRSPQPQKIDENQKAN